MVTSSDRSGSVMFYLLVIALLFQSASALYGGASLFLDPTGRLLEMPAAFLQGSPFGTYAVPGAILFVLLGIYPAIIVYGLLRRPEWRWAGMLNAHPDQHWACTHALHVGIMLIIWIDVQIAVIGYLHWIQTVYAALGVLITILPLWPSVRRCCRVSPPAWQAINRTATPD